MARRTQALKEDYYDYDYNVGNHSKKHSFREERVNLDDSNKRINSTKTKDYDDYNDNSQTKKTTRTKDYDDYNSRINTTKARDYDDYDNRISTNRTKYYDDYDEQEYIDEQDKDDEYLSTTINTRYQTYRNYDNVEEDDDEDNNIATILLAILSGVIVLAIILFLARSPIFSSKEDVPLAVPPSKVYEVKSSEDKVYQEEIPYYKEEIKTDKPIAVPKDTKDEAISYDDKVNISRTDDYLVREERTVVPKTSSNKVSTDAPVRIERSNRVEKIERVQPVIPIYEDVDAYWIQVASFSTLEMARETKDILNAKGFVSNIEPREGNNGIRYALKVGSWTSETEANKFLNGIKSIKGLDKARLVTAKSKKRIN